MLLPVADAVGSQSREVISDAFPGTRVLAKELPPDAVIRAIPQMPGRYSTPAVLEICTQKPGSTYHRPGK